MKKPARLLNLPILWQELRLPLSLLLCSFLGGSLGYRLLYPQEPWHKIFYMTAITLSTVGYSDVFETGRHPLSTAYTMLLLLVGMGTTVYAASALTAFFVEGSLGMLLQQSNLKRKIARMRHHYIICGGGTTGIHVIREMTRCKVAFVVIDTSAERIQNLRQEFPDLVGVVGDATLDEVLLDAGVQLAQGLVASLTNDKDNLFLTLTARQLNPEIKIVSKAVDVNLRRRLEIAGANYIVSPNFIGGMRMASEMLRPNVVSFLDRMLRGQQDDIRVQEVVVGAQSPHVGKNFGMVKIFTHTGVQILALLQPGKNQDYQYNPGPDALLQDGTVLLFIGDVQQQAKLQALLN